VGSEECTQDVVELVLGLQVGQVPDAIEHDRFWALEVSDGAVERVARRTGPPRANVVLTGHDFNQKRPRSREERSELP
jgi:hypothetical protein